MAMQERSETRARPTKVLDEKARTEFILQSQTSSTCTKDEQMTPHQ